MRDTRSRAGPGEALAPDADAVAHGLALLEHEVEIRVLGVDDQRAGRLLGLVVDQRAPELRRQFLARTGLGLLLGRQRREACVGPYARGRGRRCIRLGGPNDHGRPHSVLLGREGTGHTRCGNGRVGPYNPRAGLRRQLIVLRPVAMEVIRGRRQQFDLVVRVDRGCAPVAHIRGRHRISGLRPATAGRWRKRPRLHHRRVVERAVVVIDARSRSRRGRIGMRRRWRRWIILCPCEVARPHHADEQRRKRPRCAQIHPPPPHCSPSPHAIAHEQGTFKTACKPPTPARDPVGRGFLQRPYNSGICTKNTGFFTG